MGFKSGKDWNGNRKGAPKKEFRRDDFTDELFLERKEDIRSVTERLFIHAKDDKPWAIKLVFEYFLTRPKNRDEFDNNEHVSLVGTLSGYPPDILMEAHAFMMERMKERGKENHE